MNSSGFGKQIIPGALPLPAARKPGKAAAPMPSDNDGDETVKAPPFFNKKKKKKKGANPFAKGAPRKMMGPTKPTATAWIGKGRNVGAR